MKRKFWNWIRNEDESVPDMERTLFLNGMISDETWYGDEVTPQLFKDELNAGNGNITVWINSPGGDVFAAAQIYNMLRDYKGSVTVKIDGIAASAASVIAMAGDTVCVSPVAMMMIHNPATMAMGEAKDMQKAIAMLNEVKESILNAYEFKTGITRARLSHMMVTRPGSMPRRRWSLDLRIRSFLIPMRMRKRKGRMSRKKSRRKAVMEKKGKKRMTRIRTGKRSSLSSRIP